MSIFLQRVCMFLVFGGIVTLFGCGRGELPIQEVLDNIKKYHKAVEETSKSWHEIMKWQAEEYFDDPQVIELCRAIEKENFTLVDKLITEGADANAVGKDNMTPLLWAYPKNNIMIFKRLLEAGADPNIQVTSDFGVRSSEHIHDCRIDEGISVLEMASKTSFSGYFKAVMEHGGNPNLVSKVGYRKETPLHTVIDAIPALPFNRTENVKLLIDAGADINAKSAEGETPLTYALLNTHARGNELYYDMVTLLIELGADWEDTTGYTFRYGYIHENFLTVLMAITLEENEVRSLIDMPIDEVIKRHTGLSQEMINKTPAKIKNAWNEWRKEKVESYNKLIALLKEKGADIDEAREDIKLGDSFSFDERNKRSEEENKIISDQIKQRLKERQERKEQKLADKAKE